VEKTKEQTVTITKSNEKGLPQKRDSPFYLGAKPGGNHSNFPDISPHYDAMLHLPHHVQLS
jgi:hypothetical protein